MDSSTRFILRAERLLNSVPPLQLLLKYLHCTALNSKSMIQDFENPNMKSIDEDKFNPVARNLERGGVTTL